MVLSALLPTVNNSLHCRPRRGETRLKDILIHCERQKRPVTTEQNLLSKERSWNKPPLVPVWVNFCQYRQQIKIFEVLFPYIRTSLTEKAQVSFTVVSWGNVYRGDSHLLLLLQGNSQWVDQHPTPSSITAENIL